MSDIAERPTILIVYDDSGFSLNLHGFTFETDYCGLVRENEVMVVKNFLEFLGYNAEVFYNTDEEF